MDLSAFDLLHTAVLLLDGEARIAHANAAAEELFSVSRRQLSGRLASSLFEGGDTLQAHLKEVMAGRYGALRQDLTLRHPERPATVHVAIVPLLGQPWAGVLEVREIERQSVLDRQQQLGRELEALRESLRNLAHEVRNPLGGLRGAAQLLDAELEAPGLREYTGVIMAEADRLRALVDRLLAPRGQGLRKAPFNIHQACERVLALVLAEFPGIAVTRDYDASVPDVQADFEQVLQALLNIARNAAQSLAESAVDSPRLTMRTRIERGPALHKGQPRLWVAVSVIDNGPGVPPSLHDKVFHPLVTGRAQGTGLGLSLAQEYIHQHGGVLEFESRPGQTVFQLTLPLEPLEST